MNTKRLRNAAVILLGLGDKYAPEILKNMSQEEVELIVKEINEINNVTDIDVIEALNDFFKESIGNSGIDPMAKEFFKHSLSSAVESGKVGAFGNVGAEKAKWLELAKWQSVDNLYNILQDEHPQIIAMVVTSILSSEKAAKLIKIFPPEVQTKIIIRMTSMGAVATFAMESLAQYFEECFAESEKYSQIGVDTVESVANIISHLDTKTEELLMNTLSQADQALTEQINEKIFPFERLAQLDNKSLQTLLKEVNNDDLVIALKGADDFVKNVFMKNMSSKSAEILKDEIESKGPVKINSVIDAQKRIVMLAKKMSQEEKIIMPIKDDAGIIV